MFKREALLPFVIFGVMIVVALLMALVGPHVISVKPKNDGPTTSLPAQ